MSIRINSNSAALNTQHAIGRNSAAVRRQLDRLSSGLRVGRAADDPSGLSISEGMRGELAGLHSSVQNAEQASNLLQVAEGSLQEVNNMLVRLRELAIQSGSSTVTDANRDSLSAEFSQLVGEIDRIAQTTTYNKASLLTGFGNRVASDSSALAASGTTGVEDVSLTPAEAGTYRFVDEGGDEWLALGNGATTQNLDLSVPLDGGMVATGTTLVANFDRLGIEVTLSGNGALGASGAYTDGVLDGFEIRVEAGTGGVFHVGPDAAYVNRLEVGITDLRASGPTLNLGDLSIDTLSGARAALSTLDAATVRVASERGKLGATQNRLAFAVAYSENGIESIQASDASIRDADMAQEVTELTRSSILVAAGSATLVHANLNAMRLLSWL